MSAAFDTNVLIRLLIEEEPEQSAAVNDFITAQRNSGEPIHILLGVLLETEWVLRSRYLIAKEDIVEIYTALLESTDATIEDTRAFEEALFNWRETPGTDFTDALLCARAWSLGIERFVTFDKRAARLPHAELLG